MLQTRSDTARRSPLPMKRRARKIGIGDEIGRPFVAADDFVEEFYGGGHPRARCHVSLLVKHAATMNTPDAQRPRSELSPPHRPRPRLGRDRPGPARTRSRAPTTWTWLFAWPNYVLDARKVLAETDSRPLRARRPAGLRATPRPCDTRRHHRRATDCAAQARRLPATRDGRRSSRWAIPSPSARRSTTTRPGPPICSGSPAGAC